ncbi:Mannose-6-phosphate isomerase [Podosphaera aphanis]|nr:Mannose-6-phosphate isomerase [Podosphaera aphanis]
MKSPLIRLQCGLNSYDWGKKGNNSAAARLATATPVQGFSIQEDRPYAELWMGTHPSNPSKDFVTQQNLLDFIKDNPEIISPQPSEQFTNGLPFLFKVLSIGKALSIQAHPNKKLAEHLHKTDSANYPDDNHKPEMTIAITSFEGLCGFRPLKEISHFLSTVPSLRSLIGETIAEEFQTIVKVLETSDEPENELKRKKALQKIFGVLMHSKKEDVEPSSKLLIENAQGLGADFAAGGGQSNSGQELADLVVRLNEQFPGDIGLFVLFFLNYVKLEAGEAMFLQADDIHAYLSGDAIECMAASDNVVRAGFTPKFKDVDTLVDMLTYSSAPIEEQKMDPVYYPYVTLNAKAYSSGSSALLYDPPIEEFSVVGAFLKGKGAKATFEQISGPSIILCTAGSGTITVGSKVEIVETGYVYFVGAQSGVVLESDSAEFNLFKAFYESRDT